MPFGAPVVPLEYMILYTSSSTIFASGGSSSDTPEIKSVHLVNPQLSLISPTNIQFSLLISGRLSCIFSIIFMKETSAKTITVSESFRSVANPEACNNGLEGTITIPVLAAAQ